MTENDELRWLEDALGFDGITSELNVLPGLWTARVTSHVSIDGVDAGITRANVVEAGRLLDRVLPESGLGPPRIGVCRTQSARGGERQVRPSRTGRHRPGDRRPGRRRHRRDGLVPVPVRHDLPAGQGG
ncbi:hypothetical protein ACWGJT_15585 [Streptomyces xantholiticus]